MGMMAKEPSKKDLAELDTWLASGGFSRAKKPKGALKRARSPRKEILSRRGPTITVAAPLLILRPETWRWRWLRSGFSTRPGGHSTCFGGHDLNLGFQKHDVRPNVERNRQMFTGALHGAGAASFPRRVKRTLKADLVTLKQIHSSVIHIVSEDRRPLLVGDGAVTNVPGKLLAVQTADCVPVLLVDVRQKAVGAFHAGWRGTAKRIVEKGVGVMRMAYGSDPYDIHTAIGPCIHQCCYAVGDEVVEEFHSQFTYAPQLFREVYDDDPIKLKYPLLFLTARAPGHSNIGPQIHLDLVEANRRQLLDAGVPGKNIWISDLCTSCNTDRLFSHRREGGFTGRMMGAVGIE
jgi:YfiH family protein